MLREKEKCLLNLITFIYSLIVRSCCIDESSSIPKLIIFCFTEHSLPRGQIRGKRALRKFLMHTAPSSYNCFWNKKKEAVLRMHKNCCQKLHKPENRFRSIGDFDEWCAPRIKIPMAWEETSAYMMCKKEIHWAPIERVTEHQALSLSISAQNEKCSVTGCDAATKMHARRTLWNFLFFPTTIWLCSFCSRAMPDGRVHEPRTPAAAVIEQFVSR